MNCAECGKRLPDDARFCSACGRRVGVIRAEGASAAALRRVEPTLGTPPPPAPAGEPARARGIKLDDNATRGVLASPYLPVAFVLSGCVIAAAAYWSSSRDELAGKAGADRVATTPTSATSQPVAPGPVQFSARKALQGMYGNYDPVVDGAYWTVTDAPKQWGDWNGKRVAIKPLVSRTNEAGTRHILVTNSVDVKDGMVVKQGAGCRTCKSLLGAALFERQDDEWQLVADHRFVTVEGVWGAPPSVAVAFQPGGPVELHLTSVRGSQSGGGEAASVLLVDRDGVVRSGIAPASHEPRPKRRPIATATSRSPEIPFPSSADGP